MLREDVYDRATPVGSHAVSRVAVSRVAASLAAVSRTPVFPAAVSRGTPFAGRAHAASQAAGACLCPRLQQQQPQHAARVLATPALSWWMSPLRSRAVEAATWVLTQASGGLRSTRAWLG